jgi:hypothetical protein
VLVSFCEHLLGQLVQPDPPDQLYGYEPPSQLYWVIAFLGQIGLPATDEYQLELSTRYYPGYNIYSQVQERGQGIDHTDPQDLAIVSDSISRGPAKATGTGK